MDNTIYFYKAKGDYGCFSNFAKYPIFLDGKIWPTSEHYYQAQKFDHPFLQEEVRNAESAMMAAKLGRDPNKPLRKDWEKVKDDVMRKAVYAKFTQHCDLHKILTKTNKSEIVEHTKYDIYWADGGDGSGKNMLGKFLMETRTTLNNESELVNIWHDIIIGNNKSWVLFANGTCVLFPEENNNLVKSALHLLKEYGPATVGSESADFSIITLDNKKGWVVTSAHNDILTFVDRKDNESRIEHGLIGWDGRSRFEVYAKELDIIYVYDREKC